eukprot:tig00000615_g2606.t1
MAAADGGAEEVVLGLARDLNCLTDNDRNVRRKALERLDEKLITGAKPAPDVLQRLLEQSIARQLVRVLADQVGKCRELGAKLLYDLVAAVPDPAGAVPHVLPSLFKRIGVVPLPEDIEEVRLQLVEVLAIFIQRSPSAVPGSLEDIVCILQHRLQDQFPDVRRASCDCVRLLVQHLHDRIGAHASALMKPLMSNFVHQHSKVRSSALEAVGAVVPTSGVIVDEIIPSIRGLLFDRAGQIRELAVSVGANWLSVMPTRKEFMPKILPLLLQALSDEQESVRAVALRSINALGAAFEESHPDQAPNLSLSECPHLSFQYPEPLKERPRWGARALMTSNLSAMAGLLAAELADWTVRTRHAAVGILHYLQLFVEEHITAYLDSLLVPLCKAVVDDDASIVQQARAASEAMGHFADLDGILWPCFQHAQGGGPNTSLTYRVGCLIFLAGIVKGAQHNLLAQKWTRMCHELEHDELRTSEHVPMQKAVLLVMTEAMARRFAMDDDTSFRIFHALIQILTIAKDDDVKAKALNCLSELGASTNQPDLKSLFLQHFDRMLHLLEESSKGWTKSSQDMLLFQNLLEHGSSAAPAYMDRLLSIFLENLQVSKDPEVRMSMLATLNNMTGSDDFCKNAAPYGGRILQEIMIPNCIWRVGRAAAFIRKTCMACMYSFLGRDVISRAHALEVFGEMLPVLNSCLEDDYDPDTRFLTCGAFRHLFTLLGHSITEDEIRLIYPELLKRLDDSNDRIRIELCKAFQVFAKALPANWSSSLFGYMVKALLMTRIGRYKKPSARY